MSKTVAIITCIGKSNFGNRLQNYALQKVLEAYNFKVETLINTSLLNNVENYEESLKEYESYQEEKEKRDYENRHRIAYFEEFDKKVHFNEEMITALNLPNTNYDYYIVGSDQIWNNYYTGEFDKAFFLDFTSNKDICISLSSSFGKNKFNKNEQEIIKKALKKYSLLSIREQDGKEILDKLNIKPNMVIYDPTLLLNYDFWNNFSKSNPIKEKYILVYQLHGDSDAYEKAIEFAKKENLKVVRIVTMYHQIRIGCKNVIVPEIPEFIGLIKNAEYVITDSFHGTVFSIIFKRKVGVRLPMRFSNRITSFLESIDSSEIIIEETNKWKTKVNDRYMEKANSKMRKNRDKMISKYITKLNKLNEGVSKNEN